MDLPTVAAAVDTTLATQVTLPVRCMEVVADTPDMEKCTVVDMARCMADPDTDLLLFLDLVCPLLTLAMVRYSMNFVCCFRLIAGDSCNS